jgi:subtilisin
MRRCRRLRVLSLAPLLLILSAEDAAAVVAPEALYDLVARKGSARVIVQLHLTMIPEGRLGNADTVASQRRTISAMRSALSKELARARYRTTREFDTIPFVALEIGPDALSILERSPAVAGIEADVAERASLGVSVPLIGANQAVAAGFDGTGMTVAILDTGVDGTHGFLAGKVVSEACFSDNGNCPNGMNAQIGPGAGAPCTYAPSGCAHGTHVAGIAAGSGSSLSGVARGANVIAIQVFSRFEGKDCEEDTEDPCTQSFVSDQMAALERVFNLRHQFSIAAVNLSVGGGQFAAPCDAQQAGRKAIIDNLRSVGIATVAAAGNESFSNALNAPACISTVVSVGSSTKAEGVSAFSNSASFLSLLAPGSSIQSSVPGGGFAAFSGTSQATPHVTGAWAILKQRKPTVTVDEALDALSSSGLPITDPKSNITTPRIRVNQALQIVAGSDGVPAAGVPRILSGVTAMPGGPAQRTFRTTDPIAFSATYVDDADACVAAPPVFVQLFVFSLEGLFVNQLAAASTPLSLNSKVRVLSAALAAGSLSPGDYKFTFLARDCTDAKSAVQSQLLTFRVVGP